MKPETEELFSSSHGRAMALNSSSYPSTSPSSSAALLRRPCASRSTRSRFDLSFPFCNPERTKRLAVRSQAADRDPTNLSPLSSNGISKSDTCATNEATNASPSSSSSAAAIDFLTLCHRLKTTKRKGWINHGIKGPESIADHMYRMALMALVAGDIPDLDRERCIKIAIVHDIAEAIVGDITPSDGVPKEEKTRMEQAALNEMCKILGGGLRAEELQELWAEYENNSSMEASLVKDFDKVELILQALEYEIEHGKVLDEFFLSTAGKFQTEIGRRWAAEVTSRRNVRLGNRQVT